MWNLSSFCLETLLVSMLHRCTVCVERTIGSEIILDPMELLGDVGDVESLLFLFGDSVSVGAS